MERQCIYPKEVQFLTGKSERYARYTIQKIKKLHNKDRHQLVTIEECCAYLGLNCENVRKRLK